MNGSVLEQADVPIPAIQIVYVKLSGLKDFMGKFISKLKIIIMIFYLDEKLERTLTLISFSFLKTL